MLAQHTPHCLHVDRRWRSTCRDFLVEPSRASRFPAAVPAPNERARRCSRTVPTRRPSPWQRIARIGFVRTAPSSSDFLSPQMLNSTSTRRGLVAWHHRRGDDQRQRRQDPYPPVCLEPEAEMMLLLDTTMLAGLLVMGGDGSPDDGARHAHGTQLPGHRRCLEVLPHHRRKWRNGGWEVC